MPLGYLGILAPQFGIATAMPVLVPVVAAGVLIGYIGYRIGKN